MTHISTPGHPTTCDCTRRLRHVPLVSRRFSEACRDPSTWPELHVLNVCGQFPSEAHWQSFMRWLAVRAPGLCALVFGNEVRHLRPG